jgi:hypothetical protein
VGKGKRADVYLEVRRGHIFKATTTIISTSNIFINNNRKQMSTINIYRSQALVSFKKYMPSPYFKINIRTHSWPTSVYLNVAVEKRNISGV